MQAQFGIEREHQNALFYKEYKNDKGKFQFHSQVELYFVDDGEMEVTVDGLCRTLKSGEMSVAASFVPHGYKTPKNSKSSVFIIPHHMCEDFVKATKNKKVTNPFICNKDTVKKIKSYIYEIITGNLNEIKFKGLICLILGTVTDCISLEESKKDVEPTLSAKILLFIHDNFKKSINLDTIAMEFGYSKSYLSRFFKSSFGIGINRYISTIRLKNAIELMHENKHSITYCALDSGFGSMRTFYRDFMNEFGMSPKEYIDKNIIGTA